MGTNAVAVEDLGAEGGAAVDEGREDEVAGCEGGGGGVLQDGDCDGTVIGALWKFSSWWLVVGRERVR